MAAFSGFRLRKKVALLAVSHFSCFCVIVSDFGDQILHFLSYSPLISAIVGLENRPPGPHPSAPLPLHNDRFGARKMGPMRRLSRPPNVPDYDIPHDSTVACPGNPYEQAKGKGKGQGQQLHFELVLQSAQILHRGHRRPRFHRRAGWPRARRAHLEQRFLQAARPRVAPGLPRNCAARADTVHSQWVAQR